MPDEYRVRGERVAINTEDVRRFFEHRGAKPCAEHTYTSVLYQDGNPELAEARDRLEKARILPLLALDSRQHLLDVGCGMGRWADALHDRIGTYIGIDASQTLIELARKRRQEAHISFLQIAAEDISLLSPPRPFDRVIISGLLIYLNDDQVTRLVNGLISLLAPNCLVYVREPTALVSRLTLNGFWSEELKSRYNAIYRTVEELDAFMIDVLIGVGFRAEPWSRMYSQNADLDNRQETVQQFTILRRGSRG